MLSADHRIRPGDALDLHVKLDRIQLFDPESSLSLAAERPVVAA